MKEKRNIKSLKDRREIGQYRAMIDRWMAWALKCRLNKAKEH